MNRLCAWVHPVVLGLVLGIAAASAGAAAAGRGQQGAAVPLPPLKEADLSSANALDLLSAATDWKLPPAQQPTAAKLRATFRLLGSRATQTPDSRTQTGRIIFTGAPSHQMVASYHVVDLRARAMAGNRMAIRESRIIRTDLRTGANNGAYVLPPGSEAVGASGDGQHVLVRNVADGAAENRVDFYKLLPGGKFEHIAGWTPHKHSVDAADVLSPELVLTHETFHGTTLWKLPDCQALWTVEREVPFSPPAISPDRKHLALTLHGGLFVIETETGIAVAKLESENAKGQTAWHPDGARLAMVGDRVIVWDVARGERLHDFTLPKGSVPSSANAFGLAWSGNGHLMLNRQLLIDLDLGMVVWNYLRPHAAPPVNRQPDARFWTCTDTYGDSLVGLELPHDAARKAIAAAGKDTWAVPEGSAISIQVNLAADAAAREAEMKQRLRAMLVKAGHKPSDQPQPVQLLLEVRQGAGTQVQYGEGIFGKTNVQTVTAPTFECRLAYLVDGQEVWSHARNTGGSHPSTVHLAKNQTIQQYLDEMNAKSYSWFLGSLPGLPKKVARPLEKPGFGASRITPAGPVPADQP